MANLLTSSSLALLLCVAVVHAQHGVGGGRGTPSRPSFRGRQGEDYDFPDPPATQVRTAPANNVNNGVVKALEAKIAAMEELIREYEEKDLAIREREHTLQQNRLALEERMRKEEKRIREREIGLEKREAEVTAYQNQVLKDQNERERRLEVLSRRVCY